MLPELVIFDCDGVLVDSEPLANKVLVDALSRHGLHMTVKDSMATFVGLSMPSVVEKANEMLAQPLPETFIDDVQRETLEAFKGRIQKIPHVDTLIEALQTAGVKTCVASSGGFDKMAVTLGETRLKPYFNGHIFSSSQVKRGKPFPDLFLYAAQQMEVSPQNCVVIEDSRYGVEAARNANMTVLAYVPEGDSSTFEGAKTTVIQDMKQAKALLGV